MEAENVYAATDSQPQRLFHLPYANSVIESFLTVAENASIQARANQDACTRAMSNNENTMSDIMPVFPQMQENYSSSLVYSTRSLMLSAESAYQAQSSVCEALGSAIQVTADERNKLIARLQELNAEIAWLEQQAAQLRYAFSQVADKHSISPSDAYATDEAKQLLATLETAYQRHDLHKKLSQYQMETEANLSYLLQAQAEAQNTMNEIASLAQRARDEWRMVSEVFRVTPEQFAVQGETMEIFQEPLRNQLEEERAANLRLEQERQQIQEQMQSQVQTIELLESPKGEIQAKSRPSAWSLIWTYVKIIIVAFLIACVLRAHVFELTMVDGTSMAPTLEDGDKLITYKLGYHLEKDPQRGDIVVLNAPDMPGHDYIKRIIGLPNEQITITSGDVFIDGERLNEGYLDDVYTEGDIDMVIPDGYYFVMGDNRMDSRDSRQEGIGVISRDDINGKAVLRLLPLSDFGSVYK